MGLSLNKPSIGLGYPHDCGKQTDSLQMLHRGVAENGPPQIRCFLEKNGYSAVPILAQDTSKDTKHWCSKDRSKKNGYSHLSQKTHGGFLRATPQVIIHFRLGFSMKWSIHSWVPPWAGKPPYRNHPSFYYTDWLRTGFPVLGWVNNYHYYLGSVIPELIISKQKVMFVGF